MPAKIGVLLVHGMGAQTQDFADVMIGRITHRLGTRAADVAFEPCFWADLLQRQQNVTFERLKGSGDLDLTDLRRWILSAFGDPVMYLSGYFKAGRPTYLDVHQRIRAALGAIEARLARANAPLAVIAHSLGSVIVSNYLWDEGAGQGIGTTPFEQMDTLTGLITFGSNIPLFLPTDPPVRCVRFPSPRLAAHLTAAAAWENVYDPDDVLGFPLAKIWDDTQGTVIDDIAINAGTWPLSETPLSHQMYDRDQDFLAVIERRITAILAAI